MSELKKFSYREAIGFGWQTMKNHFGFFVSLLILMGVVNFLLVFLNEITGKKPPVSSLINNVLGPIVGVIFSVGILRIALKLCRQEQAGLNDLIPTWDIFWKFLVGSIIYTMVMFAGLLLLIVPGIIWGIQFQYFGFLIVDRRLGPIEALKESSRMTKGVRWDLFVFGFVCIGVTLLGFLALLIGLFAALPTTYVAIAYVYNRLLSQASVLPVDEASAQ